MITSAEIEAVCTDDEVLTIRRADGLWRVELSGEGQTISCTNDTVCGAIEDLVELVCLGSPISSLKGCDHGYRN